MSRMEHESQQEKVIREYYGYSQRAWRNHLSDDNRAKLRGDYYYDISPKVRKAVDVLMQS